LKVEESRVDRAAPGRPVDPRRERALAFLALLLGGAAIAFSPIFVRLADVGPMQSAFWRVGLALPFLAGWSAWTLRRRRPDASDAPPMALAPALAAGLFFAGDLGFWHLSIVYTTVANASLLANFAPIFVTLGGWLLFRQRVTRLFLVALAISLGGAALLVGPSFGAAGTQLAGDAYGAITAMFYGAYMLAIWRSRGSGGTAAVMALSSAVSALLLLPVALAWGGDLLPRSPHGWLVILALAVIPHVMGQSLIAYAMAHLPASLSALSLLVQPVFAAAYAWLILGEGMGAMQVAGGAIVLAGIYLARRWG
jgi:drug/metabolite transporter (DMT)-like permease